MRLIERLPPLTFSSRRADVAAFWIVFILGASAVAVLSAVSLHARAPWIFAAGVAGVALMPGLIWRPWFEAGVDVWNRFVQAFAGMLRRYLLAVSYYVLFVAARSEASSRAVSPTSSGTTNWLKRSTDAGESAHLAREQALLVWVRDKGGRWAVCLVPLMLLLSVLRDRNLDSTPPRNTYTLY